VIGSVGAISLHTSVKRTINWTWNDT